MDESKGRNDLSFAILFLIIAFLCPEGGRTWVTSNSSEPWLEAMSVEVDCQQQGSSQSLPQLLFTLKTLREGALHSRGIQVFSCCLLPSGELRQNTWIMNWNKDTYRSHSVDGTRKAVVSYGSIPCFNWPQGLAAIHRKEGWYSLPPAELDWDYMHRIAHFLSKKAKVSYWDWTYSIIYIKFTENQELRNKE